MPITPAYTWQESPTWVTIHVALRSVSPANIDIITTDCYVKVNCHPYFFQVDLFEDIEIDKSSAVVDNGTVRFFLVKKHKCLWGRLNAVGERKDILFKREQSLELERQRKNKLQADAKVKAAQIGRLAVQSQMKLDQEKRKLVEERKAEELKLERDMIQSWQTKVAAELHSKPSNLKSSCPTLCLDEWTDPINTSFTETKRIPNFDLENHETVQNFECITGKNEAVVKSQTSENIRPIMHETKQNTKVSNLSSTILPAPRENVSVCVKFTPKSLSVNLPARESRDKVRLKEKNVTTADTIDISEREPLFLQDKGDTFYEKNNFRSAINAYTDAVQKDPSLLLCFANRAACFLQLKKFEPCIEDCTAALLLLQGKKLNMQEELSPLFDVQTKDKASYDTRLEGVDIGLIKSYIQESLKLLRDFIHSKEKNISQWYNLTRRQILVRRGTAFCNLKEFNKAKLDFDEVFSCDIAIQDLKDTFFTLSQGNEIGVSTFIR